MKRGEVWWANYPPASPRPHPVVHLSWDSGLNYRDLISIAQIATSMRGLDAEDYLDRRDGLLRPCVANLDAIATIERDLLIERLCALPPARMYEIERAIHIALRIRLPCDIS